MATPARRRPAASPNTSGARARRTRRSDGQLTHARVLEAAIEAGASDAASDESGHVVTCGFEELGEVAARLEERLGQPLSVKAVWRAKMTTPLDEEGAQSLMKLLATIEDDDDVQNVYTNFEVSDDVMARLTAA